MTRVTALADIHLGLPSAPGLSWALTAVQDAADAGTDLIVVAGDVVDRGHATDEVVDDATTLLRAAVATGVDVLLLWGNHDISADLPRRLTPLLPDADGLTVAPTEGPVSLQVGGLTVHTVSVTEDPDPRRLVGQFPVADVGGSTGKHLGVLHTSLTGEYSRKPCLPTTVDELESRGYDRWLLAHVHRRIAVTDTIGWIGMGHVETLEL